MASHERHFSHNYYGGGKPQAQFADAVLKSQELRVERKTFILAVRENPRGRLLRITEGMGGQRNNVIIPASGLEEFRRVFDEMTEAAQSIPSGGSTPDAFAPRL
jgi:hypothetical protein